MPKSGNIWLEGAYYIDTNDYGELRIVGPGNHLLLGATGLAHRHLKVLGVKAKAKEVEISLRLRLTDGFIGDPAMGHIRRVRQLTQFDGRKEPSFADLAPRKLADLSPQQITAVPSDTGTVVTFLRTYGRSYYGTCGSCRPAFT
jgi:hypothetical protein